jgi:hypothetical protein
MRDYSDEAFEYAKMCERDPAFLDSFKAHLIQTGLWGKMGCPVDVIKLECPPPAAPPASTITAIQIGLFDNWPSGAFVKGTPNRFGMSIEIWDAPADEIEAYTVKRMNYRFKSNVALMDRKALRCQIKNLRKPRANRLSNVDQDYLSDLDGIARDMTDDTRIGLLNTTVKTDDAEYHRGVYYHPYQLMHVELAGDKVQSAKLLLDTMIDLAPFAITDCHGKGLGRNVAAQSRTDIVGFDSDWMTK